jgi:nucleoside-diphosphate-sugar epimerase/SAM-dependent methyltransferase
MRILLTGHLGYIGTVMTPMLLAAGHDVTGLDSDLYSRCTFAGARSIVPVPWIRKDIRDVEVGDLRGFDAVAHLAALSNDPLGDLDPSLTDAINHRASVRLAALAREAGVKRFVFSSSCSSYGASTNDFIDESGELNPVTPYGVSKVMAEQGIAALADRDFSPTLMRSATAYGVSPRLRFDLVLNNLVAWAYTTGKIHMKSDGSPWRPIVHIEDISRAFLAVLEAPREQVHLEVFNVGSTAHNYRIRELAEIVARVVPGCEVEFAEGAGPDKRNYRVNCDKIRARLPRFQPAWDAERAALSLLEAYRSAGIRLEDFEGPRYQRIGHIRKLISDGVLDAQLRHRAAEPLAAASTAAERAQTESADEAAARFAARCEAGRCRSCQAPGLLPILDLGAMPLSDGLLRPEDLGRIEPRFPLELALCPRCTLVQILETVPPAVLFGDDYPYFSSFSDALLAHSRANALELIERLGLGPQSLVVELASNDGYLLRNFVERGIPVLGIDPAAGPVQAARAIGVDTLHAFFTRELARQLRSEGRRADLVLGNNVLAHVADTNGFVAGIALLLKEGGSVVIEAPYVRDLIDHGEFDTIYHEHLCYFSATSAAALFERHGLHLNDVRRLPIHGGSLRMYVSFRPERSRALQALLREEQDCGLTRFPYYRDFARRVEAIRGDLRKLIADLRQQGKRIAAYGAAAKGTIMLNYAGLDASSIDFVVDRNVHKQGRYVPGARLRICAPEELLREQPDYVLILPWNFRDEIVAQQAEYRARGGRFIVPIPAPAII